MAQRNLVAFAAAAAVSLAVLPLLPPYAQYVAARAAVAALFATGFTIVFGLAGIASLGHAALAGGGAYAVALFSARGGAPPALVALAVVTYGAVAGALMGVATLRTRGIYALLITLMIAQSVWGLAAQDAALAGGDTGITGIARPAFLAGELAFALAAVALAFAGVFAIRALVASRFGRLLAAARSNEARLRSLGCDAGPLRVAAFALSGIVCAIAGALGALFRGSVNPALLDWPASAGVLIAAILGGATTVAGPPLAAAALVVLEALLGSTQRWPSILGAIFIATAVFVPRGIGGRFVRRERFVPPAASDDALFEPRAATPSAPLLAIEDLDYAIGANRLFRGFTFALQAGERRAIVGPNGAGKSTLFALISGERIARRGHIRFAGADITRAPAAARARMGIGRTFQFGSLFNDHTIAQNLRVAALAHRTRRPGAAVAKALREWNLDDVRDRLPGELSAGRRRIAELALASLARPRLLLLDEPTAGIPGDELDAVVAALAALPPSMALLVIEHDRDVARRLCTDVTELGGDAAGA